MSGTCLETSRSSNLKLRIPPHEETMHGAVAVLKTFSLSKQQGGRVPLDSTHCAPTSARPMTLEGRAHRQGACSQLAAEHGIRPRRRMAFGTGSGASAASRHEGEWSNRVHGRLATTPKEGDRGGSMSNCAGGVVDRVVQELVVEKSSSRKVVREVGQEKEMSSSSICRGRLRCREQAYSRWGRAYLDGCKGQWAQRVCV